MEGLSGDRHDKLAVPKRLNSRKAIAAVFDRNEALPPSLVTRPKPVARRRPPWLTPLLGIITLALVVMSIAAIWQRSDRSGEAVPAAARELYYLGTYQWNTRTEQGFDNAIASFEKALAIAPTYAAPHAGLAMVYNLVSQYSSAPAASSYARAEAEGEKAIALDPDFALGYAAVAFAQFYGERHFARAGELFEKAVALAPDDAQILHWSALTAMHMGHYERPLELIARAQELDPISRAILANKALILFHAGRTDEAETLLTQLAAREPDFLPAREYLATLYLDARRYADFLAAYGEATRITGDTARLRILTAMQLGYAAGGGPGMLSAMLKAQQAAFASGQEPAYKLAVTAASLGDTGAALDFLETSTARNEPDLLGLFIEPAFRPLHGDPRFTEMLAQAGLPAS